MLQTLITPQTMNIAVPLAAQIVDAFRPELEIRMVWTASNYVEVSFLFGIITFRKGERREFIIRGKRGFCEAVLSQLREEGNVKVLAGSEFFT